MRVAIGDPGPGEAMCHLRATWNKTAAIIPKANPPTVPPMIGPSCGDGLVEYDDGSPGKGHAAGVMVEE